MQRREADGADGGQGTEPERVKTLDTTLDIIEGLCDLGSSTVTDLADHLDLSTSSVHSHLATLERRGYVIRDDYEYRPSLRFYGIGEEVKREHIDIYNAGHEQIKELADKTGELGWLMVEERNRGLYIHKQRGKDAVETRQFPPGRPTPLHCTAGGKAILAHLPKDRVSDILDTQGLEKLTSNTITDRETLFDELEEVRETGFAISSEEAVHGIRAVAAPVLLADQNVLGSIAISGPVSRIEGERFREELPKMLVEYSNIVEIQVQAISRKADTSP